MECFRHTGASAVGVCMACGKGLCRGCAGENPGALHCEGVCSGESRLRSQFLADAREQRSAARTMLVPIAVILFLCGAALVVLGLCWGGFWERILTVVVGAGVMLFSVLFLVVMRRVRRSSAERDRLGEDP